MPSEDLPVTSPTHRRFRGLAFSAAALTYALIVFGGIVRITGSGMACGDDWPLCNGRLIPPMDLPTLIEWGHRLAAALVGFLVLGVAVYALRHRRRLGRGALFWSGISAALLIVQVLLGAVTVRLELPTSSVVLHLLVASGLLGTLLLAAMTPRHTGARPASGGPGIDPGWAVAGAIFGFILLIFGGLVANTGAAPLCTGFPFCGDTILPRGGALVRLHWGHRLLAYLFLFYIGTAAFLSWRESASRAVLAAVTAVLLLTGLQIAVAAAMVLQRLPSDLRALHLAVGVALWTALVLWAALALRSAGRSLAPAIAPRDRRATPEPLGEASG